MNKTQEPEPQWWLDILEEAIREADRRLAEKKAAHDPTQIAHPEGDAPNPPAE